MIDEDQANFGILVVDDESFITWSLREVLLGEGYKNVLKASDGGEAIAILRRVRSQIYLIITDIVMPICSGIELIHYVRTAHKFPIGVIAISGYYGRFEQTLSELEVVCLEKPFMYGDLINLVDGILKETGKKPRARM